MATVWFRAMPQAKLPLKWSTKVVGWSRVQDVISNFAIGRCRSIGLYSGGFRTGVSGQADAITFATAQIGPPKLVADDRPADSRSVCWTHDRGGPALRTVSGRPGECRLHRRMSARRKLRQERWLVEKRMFSSPPHLQGKMVDGEVSRR